MRPCNISLRRWPSGQTTPTPNSPWRPAIYCAGITSRAGPPGKHGCERRGVPAAARHPALGGRKPGRTQPAVGRRARLGRHDPIRPLRPSVQAAGRSRRAGRAAGVGPAVEVGDRLGRAVSVGFGRAVPGCDFYLPLMSAPYALLARARRRFRAKFPIWLPTRVGATLASANWRRSRASRSASPGKARAIMAWIAGVPCR